MAEILINTATKRMAEIPVGGNCGTKGNELLLNPKIVTKVIGGDLMDHFRLGHCDYVNDEIVVKPEEEWPENQVDEEPEEV